MISHGDTDTMEKNILPKAPGETRVIALMGGDYGHNAITPEIHIRELFSSLRNWRIIFVQSSRFFTPDLLKDADLLITSRHGGADPIDWRPEGIVDSLREGVNPWTDENVNAIIRNVRERGMGFLALHCTISSRNRVLEDFLDAEPIMHNEVQPVWVRDLNREHPITRGIGKFLINLDEQFAAIIKSPETVTLFETTAIHDKRHAVGGWCLERGKGRIAVLLPGHGQWAYRVPEYQEILWRSAHWVLKRDIPPFPR
jgi:type 1 glutamine amidotransferase